MDLATYLSRAKLSHAEFGELIGRSRTVVYRYTIGERAPSLATMQRIAEVTGGKVRPNDWLERTGRAA